MRSRPKEWTVGLVGYGEVGRILAEDLRRLRMAVNAYDVKLGTPDGAAMQVHAEQRGVGLKPSHAALASSADLVISAVTASQTVAVAAACAPGMRRDAFFLDFNSASPNAKRTACDAITSAGARYVEGAVMTSMPPYRQRVPLLLGGTHAAVLAPLLNDIGFASKMASDQIGVASAVKMCRSVMIKGLEAMVIESFTAARAYGVEDALLASLLETFPGIDWEKQGAYFFQRVIEHGRRRAEEMQESARTVADAGLTPFSAYGTAQRQAWIGDMADAGIFGIKGGTAFARSADWRTEADRILAAIKEK
jgi:3-hydroxyisobutyrate dehydrogenase-like beta-hydroxyacid dehydrogenase